MPGKRRRNRSGSSGGGEVEALAPSSATVVTSSSSSSSKMLRTKKKKKIDADDAITTSDETKQTKKMKRVEFDHDEIVTYISEFVSATKSSSVVKDDDKLEKKKLDLDTVISYLIQFLQTTTTTTTTSPAANENSKDINKHKPVSAAVYITKEDVATLLLPWSVSRLMRMTSAASSASTNDAESELKHGDDEIDVLAWAALSSSLDIISSSSSSSSAADGASSSNESLLSSCFPQSTLNRLVPYAARTAFSSSQSSSDQIHHYHSNSHHETASIVYVHLVKRYKSSFDVVCKTLLCDIDSLLSKCRRENDDLILAKMTKDNADKVASERAKRERGGDFMDLDPFSRDDLHLSLLEDSNCMAEIIQSGRTNHYSPPHHQVSVVRATLEMIYTMMPNANPKRLFTILCSTEVMPRLGRLSSAVKDVDGDTLIQNILWDGLLHPVHHMDGFRTMSDMKSVPKLEIRVQDLGPEQPKEEKKEGGSSKTCFQAGLFHSVRKLVAIPTMSELVNQKDEVMKGDYDAIFAVQLLPIIVHGFFERVRQHANGSTTEADAKLQFRFWCRLMQPVLEALFSKEYKADEVLNEISQTLGLVLQYDAYLPSYSDPNEEHLAFLQSVANGMVGCINDYPTKDEALVTSFCNLTLLNHRLLHGQLSKVISYTCSRLPHKNIDARKLLYTLVKTYRELRAVGDVLMATREAFANETQYSTNTMENILLCNNVVDSLALAYQSCPSGQLKEIWNLFDGWIVESIDATSEVSFAVQMFVVFIKSIRCDKQNSQGLRSLCELSMNNSIPKLLGYGEDNKDSDSDEAYADDHDDEDVHVHMRLGLDLCGWLVELHTRSCFWIDSITVDTESSFLLTSSTNDDMNRLNVLAYLRNSAENAVKTDNFSSWKKSFLDTYWKGKGENEVDVGVSPSLRGSLQRLALHRVHQLHSMIYYCNLEESEANENDSMVESQSEVLTREAKMLVDFSFYIACSEDIGPSDNDATKEDYPLSTESFWVPIAQSLSIWSHYSEQFHSELFLIWFFTSLCFSSSRTVGQISQWEHSTSIALTRDASFYDNDTIMSPLINVGIKFALHKSKSTSTALSFIASAPVELIECSDSTMILRDILDLDILLSKSLRQSENGKDDDYKLRLTKTLCSARYMLARLLSIAVLPSGFSTSLFTRMLQHLLSSKDLDFDINYLSASSNAINECLSLCIDYYEKEDVLLQEFFTQISSNLVDDMKSSKTPSTQAFLLRGVIRKINTLNRHNSLARKNTSTSRSVFDTCAQNVLQIYESTWQIISLKISEANRSSFIELLLASELLSFLGRNAMASTEVKRSTRELFEKVLIIQNSPQQEAEMITACNYFLSIMSSTPDFLFECVGQKRVLEQVLNAISLSPIETDSQLLESSFCSLIQHTDVQGLHTATSALLNTEGIVRSSTFLIRMFHLMISSIKTQEQQKYIAGYCEQFLLISMDLLREQSSDMQRVVHNVGLFSKMMTTLLAKKELLVLSGREIAMVCSEMNPLFHRTEKIDVACDISVFVSCSSVVASLIAHYSKQLYGCPSPIFGLLLSMLTNVLHTGSKKKALEYSK